MAIIPKELREKVQETGDNFTRSPHVNYLIKVCQDVKEGKSDRESLRDPLNKLYDTYDALMTTYKSLSPTHPKKDEDFSIKAKVFLASCEAFRCALDEITLYFRDNDVNHIDLGLKLIKKETESVMSLIDEFKHYEEKAQKFSHSPRISELIRIGKGVISGEFEAGLLKPRVEIVRNIYEETSGHVQEMTKKEPDTKVLKEQIPVILEALDLFKYGLENIDKYFDHIEKGEPAGKACGEKSVSSDGSSEKIDFSGFGDEKSVSSGDSSEKVDFSGFGDEKSVSSDDSSEKVDFSGFGDEKSVSSDDSSEKIDFSGFGDEKSVSSDDSSEKIDFIGFGDEKSVSSDDFSEKVDFIGFGDEKSVSSDDSFEKVDFSGFGDEKSVSSDNSFEKVDFSGFGDEKSVSSDKSSKKIEFNAFSEKVSDVNSLLKKGLDNIQEASIEIYGAQLALKAEIDRMHRGPVRLCPRCSHEVAADLKFCSECRAIIPQMHSAQSRLDIKDSTMQEQRQFMVPPHVKKVYNAAWDVSKGKITKNDFEKILDWFENNIEENRINMNELLTIPQGITKEETKLFESIKKNIEDGVQECIAGIEDMRMYILDEDILNLETGLGKIMKGGDLLYSVKQLGERASRAGRKKK
jgi:hypothetical protein